MKKVIFLCVLSVVLIMGGIAAGAADSADETAMQPEEEEIDVASIDWTQVDDIRAFAEEHGLTFEIVPAVYHIPNTDENSDYDPEEAEQQRKELEALLEELETGEVITYYFDTGEIVIENSRITSSDSNTSANDDIDISQIDDIVAYAEEYGLTIGVDYGDEIVDYNETVAAAYAPEEFERERAEIEALLSELETGEVITYYPDTGSMVIE